MMVRSDFCRLEFTVGERDKKFVHVHSSCFLTGHLTGSIGVLTCQGIRSILESYAEKKNTPQRDQLFIESARSMGNS